MAKEKFVNKSVEKTFEHFFKPEVRAHGEKLWEKDAVRISGGSDTGIDAYVRGSGANKVSFFSAGIESPVFMAKCSCSTGVKGLLCKHMWAVLLTAVKKYPDFFDVKKDVTAVIDEVKVESPFKEKQAAYQKQRYEKQKQRLKEIKQAKKAATKGAVSQPQLPAEIQQALQYFLDNGFPVEMPFDQEYLKSAKKKLSRIFHPDLGGSHAETIELNEQFDTLMMFFVD